MAQNETARKTKKTVGYGVRPPYLDLKQCAEVVKRIYEDAGAEVSEDTLSQILGNSVGSSSFRLKVLALKSFGLIEQEGVGRPLKLSRLGLDVAAPPEPSARAWAKKESFLRIENFAKLHQLWVGKILPAEEFFLNTLRERCKIPSALTSQWKDNFIESAMEAGLLQQRTDGKIQVRSEPVVEGETHEVEQGAPVSPPQSSVAKIGLGFPAPVAEPEQPRERYPIPLPEGRVGVVELPKGWTLADVKKMIKVIQVMLLPEEGEK